MMGAVCLNQASPDPKDHISKKNLLTKWSLKVSRQFYHLMKVMQYGYREKLPVKLGKGS